MANLAHFTTGLLLSCLCIICQTIHRVHIIFRCRLCSSNGHVSVVLLVAVLPLAEKYLGTSWCFISHHCFAPSCISVCSQHFLRHYAGTIQSCLLTSFKGVNAKAIGLDMIIFDSLQGSLMLSSPEYQLQQLYYIQAYQVTHGVCDTCTYPYTCMLSHNNYQFNII